MAKRKRRNFTPKFKAEVVLEVLNGATSQTELCRSHNLSDEQLSKWKQQFVKNAASLFELNDKPSKYAAERIAHLISDLATAPRSVVPKRPGDPPFRSRRAVSFKCLYFHSHLPWN